MPSLGGWEWMIIGACCIVVGGAGVGAAAFLLAKRGGK